MKQILAFVMILLLAGCQNVQATKTATPTATPRTEPAEEAAGPVEYAFTFTAKTLEGEEVTEAFFGQYDLTMVNVWASWCGPCRGELSELGALYGRLPENVGFLSVTVDDPGDLADAKSLLEQNGCAFPCLDGQGATGLMTTPFIPTTIFFDSRGNEVGDWIVGVPQGKGTVADTYLAEIQARLDLLNGK